MQTKTQLVKSKKNVVGEIQYHIFDSTGEAVSTLGDATVLSLVNSQHRTNLMNAKRAEVVGKPSKEAIKNEALARITPEEFTTVAGDMAALQNLINKKVQEVEAEKALNAPAAGSADKDEDDDDENDD